jgi:hypothetical protein
MKFPITLFIASTLASPLSAETVYTVPQGYTKITVAAAPASGQTSLTAISATLLTDVEFSSSATLGAFGANVQPLTAAGQTWTANEWVTNGPYLAYITGIDNDENDSIPAPEEAFLISGNTADTLTLNTLSNLTATTTAGPQRFPTSTTVKIRKAHTIGSLLGTTPGTVALQQFSVSSFADNVFVWNGSGWVTYFFNETSWQRDTGTGAPDPADDVIFPDEGIFVLRRGITPIEITFFGEVPSKPQISTLAGPGLRLTSSRVPIPTAIENLGLDSIPDWAKFSVSSFADKVYRWNGSDWATYFHNGSEWELVVLASNTFTVSDPIPGNSALFIDRRSTGDTTNSGAVSTLPYTIK